MKRKDTNLKEKISAYCKHELIFIKALAFKLYTVLIKLQLT